MPELKGVSLSIWIWMIGGVITASMLILITQTSLVQLGQQTSRQAVIQDFRGLNQDISGICRQARDSQKYSEIKLPEVKAIFASNNKKKAPTESKVYVTNNTISEGKNVCLTFKDEHYGCKRHSCNIKMNYMGEPLENSEKSVIAEETGNNYRIKTTKEAGGVVRVEGNITP